MSVHVYITEGPLGEPSLWQHATGNGALVCFEGIVRPAENEQAIVGLEYEAYEPMASRQLQSLGEQLLAEHDLIAMCVEHSTGRVANGECSFRLRIASYHRKEAIEAMDMFIDRMKKDVPIWKKPIV